MKAIYEVNVKLAPILAELAEAQKSLDEGQKVLNALNKEKDECEAKVAEIGRAHV